MAKFFETSQDVLEFVEGKFAETGLDNYVQLKVISVSKQAQVFKVAKASSMVEFLGHLDDAVVISVYEEVFDRLDEKSRELLTEDAIAQISYDNEKDKLIVTQPQISVTVGGRRKFGEPLIDAEETAIHLIASIEEEEKERKAAEKEAKKQKKIRN